MVIAFAVFVLGIPTALLIFAYVDGRKKYQWKLRGILAYTILGGLIGLIVAYAGVMAWARIYQVRDGALAILGYGPFLMVIGELAGFWLYARSAARKRRREQEAT